MYLSVSLSFSLCVSVSLSLSLCVCLPLSLSLSSVVNTICISSFRYIHVITSRKFQLKYTWRLTKAIAEMKSDTEQTMRLE